MNIEKVLGSDLPLAKPIVLEVRSVGTFVAVLQALSEYGKKLIDEGAHLDRGIELNLIACDLVSEAQANGWNCGDPDCRYCGRAQVEGDGLKQARVFEIPPYDAGEA